MSLSSLLGMGTKEIVNGVKDVVDEFYTSDEERVDMMVKVESVVTDRMKTVQASLMARFEMVSSIIQAEMSQGDAYTKRARPSLVYFGMVMIFINYLLVPIIQTFTNVEVSPFELPTEFWIAWGGTVSIWTVGRSAEKRGASTKMTRGITGNQSIDVSRLMELYGNDG